MNGFDEVITHLETLLPQVTENLRQEFQAKNAAACIAILQLIHTYVGELDQAFGQRRNPITGQSMTTFFDLIQLEIRKLAALIQSGRFNQEKFNKRERRLVRSLQGMITLFRQMG